jgi:hypothetical protein
MKNLIEGDYFYQSAVIVFGAEFDLYPDWIRISFLLAGSVSAEGAGKQNFARQEDGRMVTVTYVCCEKFIYLLNIRIIS